MPSKTSRVSQKPPEPTPFKPSTPTVLDILRKRYPEVDKAVKDENIWSYRVFGPMSLDDPMEVHVSITYGHNEAGDNVQYTLTMEDVSA